jgi:anti-sigma regulatory factor (Ser/Thr protein kinase)
VPANVALVRQALAGLADELGIDAARLADMKVALTEACTNAVLHAYDEQGGPLEAAMAVEEGRLTLTVRDRGQGLRPLPSASEGPPLGFGIALIASLADEFGVAGGMRGTEVQIAFALDGSRDAGGPIVVRSATQEAWPPDGITLSLGPGEHAATVLGRVVSLLAARADFSIDRVSDAQIVGDSLAGAARAHLLGETLRIGVEEHEGGFDLLVGPLAGGGGRQLVRDTELPGLGCLLEHLTDGLEVEPVAGAPEGAERLRTRLHARS